MKFNKLFVLAAAAAFCVTACGTSTSTSSTASSGAASDTASEAAESSSTDDDQAAASDFKVALIIGTGGLGDGGFNDSLYNGVQSAAEELGITYQLVEPSEVSEFEGDYMDLSASGEYDLIIGGGFDQTEALANVAGEFPDQKYVFVDGELDGLDNVTSILFKDQEKTYMVGIVAAMNTQTGKVGMVVGMDTPSQNTFVAGFMAGAKSVNPDVEVEVKYVGSFSDTTTAKELALAEYEDGVDIVYAVAGGSGLGVFNAAEQENFYAIGVDVNQCVIDPDHIMLSSLRNNGKVVYDSIVEAMEGTLTGGAVYPGLAEEAVDVTNEGSNVELVEGTLEAVEAAKQQIISGEVVVPTTIEDVQ